MVDYVDFAWRLSFSFSFFFRLFDTPVNMDSAVDCNCRLYRSIDILLIGYPVWTMILRWERKENAFHFKEREKATHPHSFKSHYPNIKHSQNNITTSNSAHTTTPAIT